MAGDVPAQVCLECSGEGGLKSNPSPDLAALDFQHRKAQLSPILGDYVLSIDPYLRNLHLAEELVPEKLDHIDSHIDCLPPRSQNYVLCTAVEHGYASRHVVQQGLGLTDDHRLRGLRHSVAVFNPAYNDSVPEPWASGSITFTILHVFWWSDYPSFIHVTLLPRGFPS